MANRQALCRMQVKMKSQIGYRKLLFPPMAMSHRSLFMWEKKDNYHVMPSEVKLMETLRNNQCLNEIEPVPKIACQRAFEELCQHLWGSYLFSWLQTRHPWRLGWLLPSSRLKIDSYPRDAGTVPRTL